MLISYLAARVTVLPFTGIETLVANSDFKIAVNPNSYQQSVFENSVDPIWQTAWQDRIKPHMKYYEEIIGIVLKKKLINWEYYALLPIVQALYKNFGYIL